MKQLILILITTFILIQPHATAQNQNLVTYDFTKENWTNNQLGAIGKAATDADGNTFYIQISIQKGDGTNAPNQINRQYLQWFQHNTILVRNAGDYAMKITKIELISDATANYQATGLESNTGTITALGTIGRWEGSADIVTLKNTSTNNHTRIKQINVYYDNSASAIAPEITDNDNPYSLRAHIYTLSGTEIPYGTTPPPGIYIRRHGNTTEKIVIH